MTERANPNSQYSFTIALKLQNPEKLEKIVLDISNPTSPNYGNWLSREEIESIVAPPKEVSESVIEYLRNECADFEFENNKDSIKVSGPIHCAEKVFNVRMMTYEYVHKKFSVVRRHIKDEHPVFPQHIQKHISFLTCVSALPKIRKDKIQKPDLLKRADLDYYYNIPQTMRYLYNIPPGTKGTSVKNSQSVIEFLPVGGPAFSDLQKFASEADEVFNNITRIVGPYEAGSSDGESTLDVEYLTTLGAGVSTYYITISQGWIYDMANQLFTMNGPPLVVSVSYGWMEAQTCESDVTNANCTGIDAQTYVARANQELMKVAGLGLSILVAAQDEGAPSDNNQDCSLDDTYPLWSIFPASSNWVTTVSSTSYASVKTASLHAVERAEEPKICHHFLFSGHKCSPLSPGGKEIFAMANNTYYTWSGGSGFANYTARPSWQDAQVTRWLSSNTTKNWPVPPTVFFNPANRAYPDVVAVGDRILIVIGDEVSVTAGTSASTPIFAGIVSLLNDARLNAGKKPLGFLSPLLYQMQANSSRVFNDVTEGSSSWSRASHSCKYGYGTSIGWDAASGSGSINYQLALAYIKNLP